MAFLSLTSRALLLGRDVVCSSVSKAFSRNYCDLSFTACRACTFGVRGNFQITHSSSRQFKMGAILSCSKNSSEVIEASSPLCADEEVAAVVCNEEDVPENGMKAFPLGDGEVLLVRHNGQLNAVGSKCTHYGAPLEKGALGEDGTVRCPWHGACFNSGTGDIEDFPGLDSLPCYKVTLTNPTVESDAKGRGVEVRAMRSQLVANKRVKELSGKDPANNETIVVVGGGGAGSTCVEGLRQSGYTGRVVMVCGEPHLPYDRPKLSKNMASTPSSVALRTMEYYESGAIDVLLGNPALSLNSEARQLLLTDGTKLPYDKLFLATGGRPRQLTCPGAELDGVAVLRSPEDAAAILEYGRDQHVVVVGSSFIGMEVASHMSLLGTSRSVSVVGSGAVAFERSLGAMVGGRLQQLLQEMGVAFYMNDSVVEITGQNRVDQVVLSSGTVLAAGVVVCGIGVTPSTQFLEGSGIELDDRGFVKVDQFLESSVPGVFCGGDIAAFPLRYGNRIQEDKVTIGHWQVAMNHGRTAATNLIAKEDGQRVPVNSVPIFWTVLQGKSLRYAGYGGGYDDIIINGDLAGLAFVAHYLKGDEVVAMASLGRDPAVAQYAELLRSGGTLTRADVEAQGGS